MTRPLSPTLSGGPRLTRQVAPVLALALLAAIGCQENAELPTGPQSAATLATATVAAALSFRQVSAGDAHTCGVTTDNRAFCWGNNSSGDLGGGGQLGDGTTTDRLRPMAVAGGLRFLEVSAGVSHTCGVTTDNRAYCWGDNGGGQLGNGTTTNRLRPVAVAGGRRFRQVSAGYHHSCGVTTTDVAFCWGSSAFVLGTGGGSSTTPVRVAGVLRFRRVSAAFSHTCGATTGDRAYCWGNNASGQLGDGSRINRSRPVAVAGGRSFRRVLAGSGYISPAANPRVPDFALTCGVTPDNRAYCWGSGAVGTGANGSATPVAVAGGRLRSVSPGAFHACGVNPYDVAFCWGENTDGQIGDGSPIFTHRPTPVRVAGGLRFSGVTASGIGRHTCGVTTGNRAYCWGENQDGQLGNGTRVSRLTPVAVAAVP